MDLKSLLNKEQYEGAVTVEGQVLILAGAGSGKTRVLTYRMAHMIEDLEIKPWSILAITFTNKAAKEMRERVESLVGEKANDMWISTFHSTCVRILRREIDKLGYKSSFTIYDTSDQKTLLKECMKALNINDKDITLQEIMGKIGRAKDNMQGPASFMREHESNFREKKIADVYEMYQKRLKENNALDFDDLIFKTVELFKNHEDVLEFYQNKFKYIMVDEYQDTNGAQYEFVRLLAKRYKNICVVGDDDQCLTEGTLINSEKGTLKIEDVKKGDKILVAIGNSEKAIKEVDEVNAKEYKGEIVKITTESGKVIKGTPSHIGFSKLDIVPEKYYVYLMYKEGYGYRVGRTSSIRSRKGDTNGLAVRLNGEQADKMWILKVCDSIGDASYYEEYFATKYGLPTIVFNARGRELSISQERINELFKEIDTINRADKLMEEQYLYKDFPHHVSSAIIRGESIRKRINLTFFGGRKNKHGIYSHKIGLNTSDEESKKKFIEAGFNVRDGQRNTFRIETERAQYDEAYDFSKSLMNVENNFEILQKANLTEEKSFMLMPIGSIKEDMIVPIFNGDKIVEDRVVKVEIEEYSGKLYDLNIKGVRNYIANDIVVHNCIYAWRGADVTNILEFERDYPNCKVIKLEQNYRSKGNILEAANVVIVNNSRRKSKALRTEQDPGSKIKIYRAYSDKEEGDFVARQILDIKSKNGAENKDFAVLYRTNAQSRLFEETFRRRGIPYKIVGGTKFYDRKEIKDMLAYLKVLVNPQDDISIKRIINVPKRSIGDATVNKVQDFSDAYELNLWDALQEVRSIPSLTARNCASLEKFTELMDNFMIMAETMPVSILIETILKDTGYLDELKKSNEIEDKSRIENLQELVSDAVEFEKSEEEDKSLTAYLEKVSLVQDIDNEDEEENSVVLMTLHSAKGLEFPHVFMVGMENGLFPSMSDFDKEDQMEEARRLCYVGITRAKETLYMTSAEVRRVFGRTMSYSQSDFIGEIKTDLKDYVNERSTNGAAREGMFNSPSKPNFNNPHSLRNSMGRNTQNRAVSPSGISHVSPNNAKMSVDSSEITLGRKVKHPKFGEGTVVSILPSGSDKKLTIAFDKQGVKVLLLSMANLELL